MSIDVAIDSDITSATTIDPTQGPAEQMEDTDRTSLCMPESVVRVLLDTLPGVNSEKKTSKTMPDSSRVSNDMFSSVASPLQNIFNVS